jgi:hypothetical protein
LKKLTIPTGFEPVTHGVEIRSGCSELNGLGFTPGQMAAMGAGSQPVVNFNYVSNVDARGQDPSVVARLATLQAQDRKNLKPNIIAIMRQYYANNPGAR